MQRYLRCISSVDEGQGEREILAWLDKGGPADNTIVNYTCGRGFLLDEHGWFDKRFIYEESF